MSEYVRIVDIMCARHKVRPLIDQRGEVFRASVLRDPNTPRSCAFCTREGIPQPHDLLIATEPVEPIGVGYEARRELEK